MLLLFRRNDRCVARQRCRCIHRCCRICRRCCRRCTETSSASPPPSQSVPLSRSSTVNPGTCYSAAYMSRLDSRPATLYNLISGSWLSWANDTVVHHAAIGCLARHSNNWTRLQNNRYTTTSTSLHELINPSAHQLISRLAEGRRLSYTFILLNAF